MSNLIPLANQNSWCNLDKWFLEQEIYFKKNKFESDEEKINHIILNLDVNIFLNLFKFII